MKLLVLSLLALVSGALAVDLEGDFRGPLGVQLYSLRDSLKNDVPGSLDKVKGFGFTEVETAGDYNLGSEKLKALLVERGLKAVSAHVSYEALKKDLPAAVREAQALGVEFAGCPWIPHESTFGEAEVKRAAADFDTFGAAFKAAGITFFYHVHGYEFQPVTEGATDTSFDLLMRSTNPDLVSFEMDVFWVFLPGADPTALLKKYGKRWILMHIKELKKGVPRNVLTGKMDSTSETAVGSGQVPWPEVLKAAKDAGVKHYFIEDESPAVLDQIPESIRYLRTLKF